MAEKRTEAARKESVDKVEVDDLDNLATPEMIMLSAVSGEGAQAGLRIRIQSGQWIRIRIQEGKKDPQKEKFLL
jgi:hypothetical protein